MKYDDLFFRGEFINLLIKYGVDPKKWANTHHLILIPIILIGLLLLYLVRTYHVETKWNLLLTAIIGLAQGVLVKPRRTLLSENFHTPMDSFHCWLYEAV